MTAKKIIKRIQNSSFTSQLIFSTMLIFTSMLLISNFLIGKKQEHLFQLLEQQLADGTLQLDQESPVTLIIDGTEIRSLAEYRLFTVCTVFACLLIGGIILYFVIKKNVEPLHDLAEKVNIIDVDNMTELQRTIAVSNGSYEVRMLSAAFQNAMNKISESYGKQKRFTSNVAHELRTPLAVLLTRIDVYKKQKNYPDDETRALVESLETSILRLSGMVEDILFFSREYSPSKTEVSVPEIVEEVLLDLEEKAARKNIQLSPEGGEAILRTDDMLLERALYNLVDNAIKYTPAGGYCKVAIEKTAAGLDLSVIDNGIGISDDKKDAIFDLFYRAEESRSRKTGGYGIGLSLVREVVNRLGGRITVSDNKPQGSIFRIHFPQKPQNETDS